MTEDTIRLGFVDIDLPTLREMNLVDIDRGDSAFVVDTLVDELNARGGILGRKVEAFSEIVLPIDPVDAEAACVRLTEDNDVFAVLGQFAGPTAIVDTCFAGPGATIMIGGNPTPEQLAQARAPWLTTGMSAERRLVAAVQLMHDDGLLGDNIAVAVATADEAAADDLVIPELERLGYPVAQKVVQQSPSGDRAAQDAEWSVIAERLAVDGIDTVVLVQSTVGFTGANQLVLKGFEGQILIADAVGTLGSLGTSSENALEDLEGIMGTIGPSATEVFEVEASQECVEVLEAADPEITVHPSDQVPAGEPDWIPTLIGHCARLRLFEMIAIAAGPELTQETFLTAAEGLGEIELPGSPFSSLGPGKLDSLDGLRLARFDATVGEAGAASPAGPLVRIES
ncbi:MAG: hypothetical protein OES57_10715 [Acidimicrobiia bacterium]|nr:hypothetical protein [Acidimicrobiia bacterium]